LASAAPADEALAPAQPTACAAELVAEAAACLEELPPAVERAQALFEKALAAEPENTEVLDSYGAFLCEEGNCERATELLERSASLRPHDGAEKFLYLAQMASGELALAHYERGAAVLRKSLAETEGDGAVARRRQLARTQASMAELYMTDLCDLPEAEERCEAALASGAEADAECLEVLATRASLRKVQGNMDEAKELALRCAQRVIAVAKKLREGDDADVAELDTLADEDLVQLCRTLIDLMQTAEAREILEGLLEKDEEDIQVWCLLGYCHVIERDAEVAQECAGHALKLCRKLGKEAAVWRSSLKDLLQRAKRLAAQDAADEEPAAV